MGATSQAVFSELVSDGVADKALVTLDPEETSVQLWRFTNEKHLPFALEPVEWDATSSQAKFGARNVKYEVPRQADLMWHTVAKVQLPGLAAVYKDDDGNVKVLRGSAAPYWHNAIGQRVLESVTLSVGGIQIITFDETYQWIWEEVASKPGQEMGEVIGKFDTVEEQQAWARRSHTCYTTLPLPNSTDPGNALPLCAMTFHKIFIDASFAARNKCVKLPAGAPRGVQICVRPDGVRDADIESGKFVLEPLNDNHLKCLMEATMVYFEEPERNLFTENVFEQCIVEVQQVSAQASFHGVAAGETTPPVRVKAECRFASMVREYFCVVRQQAKEDANDRYDFGGYVDGVEDGAPWTLDPIKNMTVKFQNASRVQSRPADYYRLVNVRHNHSNGKRAARNFIYGWSYAQNPESLQQSGGANHSRIDDISIEAELDARIFSPESPTAELLVYARATNLLRFTGGTLLRRFT